MRLDNQGGFIQMALELAPPRGALRQGIELDVQGNGRHYGVHPRTDAMTAPRQAWRARFAAPPQWQTVRLLFEAFEPYRTGGTLDPAHIRRLGLVAIGEPGEAALCVGRVAFF